MLDSRKKLQLGVDIVTELAEGHQLAHVRTPGMKKTFSVFLSADINRLRV
jgi:hypothetical protein